MTHTKVSSRQRRHLRVRKKVVGTAERPRLAVFRSNRHIYVQLIDDLQGRTIASASSLKDGTGNDPKEAAKAVGSAVATRAKEAGVTRATFDRGGFMYHGRIQALADAACEGGLEF